MGISKGSYQNLILQRGKRFPYMERSFGALLSSIASAILIVILLAAFVAESFYDIMLYYSFNTVNPLLAGLFAIGIIMVFVGVRSGRLSESVGTGIALGLGLINLLVVTIWAFTGRVDVFLAPGWAYPVQRWVLVGVSVLVALGAVLHAWNLGLFPVRAITVWAKV